MKTVKIKDFLIRKKIPVDIKDNGIYKRLTIKTKNQGVFLRDEEIGTNIGTKKQFIAYGGQFIVSKIDAMNGAFGIIPIDISEAIITGNFWVYDVDTSLVNVDWFNLFVSLPSFSKICESLSSGTTHRKYLDEKKFSEFQLRLPSMKEQAAAVERFNEQKQITDCVLAEMEKQKKYAEMLRQSILQQAVEGKLCEQDPKDEPASVLLEKINAEKERLIAEKKIKKQKPLPPISEEEKTFVLPKGWEWCRVGALCESSLGKMLDKKKNKGQLQPYLRNLNVQWFKFNLSDVLEMRFTDEEKERYTVKYGDVVICEGGYPGMGAIWENTENIYFQKALHRNRFFFEGMNYYFLYYLYSIFYNGKLKKYYTGMGIQHLTGKSLANIPIPVPPLAELQRIVKKVEILFQLLDKLEQEISNAKLYASDLIEAVLQEAFSIQETTKPAQVIEFHPDQTIPETELLAAARGKIREDTWEHLCKRALEIAGEES